MNEEYYKNRCIELDKKLDRVIDSHTKLEDKIAVLQQENQSLKDRIERAIEWVKDWTDDPNDWFDVDAKPSDLLEILKRDVI